MSVKELKALIGRAGLSCVDCVEKSDLRARARQAVARLDEAKRIQDKKKSPPPPAADKTPQPSPAKPARSPPVPPSVPPGVPVPPRPGTYVYRAGAPPPKPPPQWQPPQPVPQKPPPPKKKWSAADMYDSDGNEKFDVTTSDESDAEAPAPGTYVYQARAPAPEKPKRRRRRETYDSDDPPSDCVSEEEYKPRGSKRRPRAAKKRR